MSKHGRVSPMLDESGARVGTAASTIYIHDEDKVRGFVVALGPNLPPAILVTFLAGEEPGDEFRLEVHASGVDTTEEVAQALEFVANAVRGETIQVEP